jgi:hypothetical protein
MIENHTGDNAWPRLFYVPRYAVPPIAKAAFCHLRPLIKGLFNALNGLGAGGQVDSTTSANSNAALYATFAFAAFFAGYIAIISVNLPHTYLPMQLDK